MFNNKIRITILTLIAAVSLSVGPMTSVASARKPRKEVKIGHIEVECPAEDTPGHTVWYEEGVTVKVVDKNTGEVHYYICQNGQWNDWVPEQETVSRPKEARPTPVSIKQEEPKEAPKVSTPPTNQERPSTPPVIAGV